MLYLHGSMGNPLQKREFKEKNEKVRTYELVDSSPKTVFLIGM